MKKIVLLLAAAVGSGVFAGNAADFKSTPISGESVIVPDVKNISFGENSLTVVGSSTKEFNYSDLKSFGLVKSVTTAVGSLINSAFSFDGKMLQLPAEGSVRVYNMSGALCAQGSGVESMSLENLPIGVYLVETNTAAGVYSAKIFKHNTPVSAPVQVVTYAPTRAAEKGDVEYVSMSGVTGNRLFAGIVDYSAEIMTFDGNNITITLAGMNPVILSKGKVANIALVDALPSDNEGGDGSADAPYLVADGQQLVKMMAQAHTANIALKNDILLIENWTPVATFGGNFNGNGFSIEGLKIVSSTKGDGFVCTNNGIIHDVVFTEINAQTSQAFGVVAGVNKGTIQNVEVTGNVVSTNTTDLLGGIAGENLAQGVVDNCYVNLNMTASCGMVGGIVGRNKGTGDGAKVTNCTTSGTITITAAKNRVGGIVGRGEGPDLIKACLSSMNISSTIANSNGFGGIFGANNNNGMRIEECMFTGSVKGGFEIGGIASYAAHVLNCLVEGASISNMQGSNIAPSAGVCAANKVESANCIVRNATITGVGNTTKPCAGINSNYQDDGSTVGCVVDGTTIKSALVQRISGVAVQATAKPLANNYACDVKLVKIVGGQDVDTEAVDDVAGLDGATVAREAMTQAWYEAIGYDMKIWEMKDGKLTLRNVGYKKH